MATYNGHNEDASGNILLSIGNGMAATLETGTTASQAYTKGAYLYYNNRLCKVTAAIAKSATLTIGTNIAYTTLGAELTSHLRASNGNELYFDYKDGKPGYYPTASKTASQFVPFGGSGFSDTIFSHYGSFDYTSTTYLTVSTGLSSISTDWFILIIPTSTTEHFVTIYRRYAINTTRCYDAYGGFEQITSIQSTATPTRNAEKSVVGISGGTIAVARPTGSSNFPSGKVYWGVV